ncbi:MAG: hypothetical protein A2X18_03075 [Bacteroidetes bacterium GWF2_40_14]|nr:MAG: hypothetical protein A2X18_03075 [Bacteroidetes bacterium GWF2_40_14]
MLPEKFIEYLTEAAGVSDTPVILDAIQNTKPKVSVRINPLKVMSMGVHGDASGVPTTPIPWCKDGLYLSVRPVFTLDPALHAGGYYVQEPSSMFLAVLEPVLNILNCRNLLDLCASPGGKTTHLISMMPRGAQLIANEVIRTRVATLKENVIKWGDHTVVVTNMDPDGFSKQINKGEQGTHAKKSGSKRQDSSEVAFFSVDKSAGCHISPFDFILVDAPCSGEGMFRKDPSAIVEWSEESVKMCAARQKRILADIWTSLKPGGLLAYSTCTFNLYENDRNISWLKAEFGAEIFDLYEFYRSNSIEDKFNRKLVNEWGIRPTKEGGFQFFPGLAEGEGFFFALLKKPGNRQWAIGNGQQAVGNRQLAMGNGQPDHEYALSINYKGEWPSVELSKEDALKYLSRNALRLEGAPMGYLRVTYNGLGLGFVKNVGSRANNLLPMNWRIRMDV